MPINNPAAGTVLVVAETEVFNGTSPLSWTDLDLTATIGIRGTLVFFKVFTNNVNARGVAFRRKGDTDELFNSVTPQYCGFGLALANMGGANYFTILMGLTNTLGIIQWRTESARTHIIDVIAYFK